MDTSVKCESSSGDQKKTKVRHKLKAIFSLGVKSRKTGKHVDREDTAIQENESVIPSTTIADNESSTVQAKPYVSPRPTIGSAWGSEEKDESKDEEFIEELDCIGDEIDIDKNPDEVKGHRGKSKFAQLWKNISRRNIEKLRQESIVEEEAELAKKKATRDRESKRDVKSFKMGVDSISSSDNELSELVNLNRVESEDETESLPEFEDDDGDTISDITSREVQSDIEPHSDGMMANHRLHPAMIRSRSTSQLSSFDESYSHPNLGTVTKMSHSKSSINDQGFIMYRLN